MIWDEINSRVGDRNANDLENGKPVCQLRNELKTAFQIHSTIQPGAKNDQDQYCVFMRTPNSDKTGIIAWEIRGYGEYNVWVHYELKRAVDQSGLTGTRKPHSGRKKTKRSSFLNKPTSFAEEEVICIKIGSVEQLNQLLDAITAASADEDSEASAIEILNDEKSDPRKRCWAEITLRRGQPKFATT